MGRLLPEDFDDASLQNDAERRVVRGLVEQLSDDWLVLPSVSFRRHPAGGGKADFEIDVLLMHERDGMVVLEVKGHDDEQLEVRDGKWYVGGRPAIRDPFAQVRSNAYELRDLLHDHHPDRLSGLRCPPFGVVFPNIAAISGSLEPGVRVVTSNDLSTLDSTISTIAGDQILVAWDLEAMRAVLAVVAPTAALHFDEGAQAEQRRQLLEADSRARLDALAGLDVNRRVYVWGGPGTGKTWLAETWARRAARNGHRTLMTCFNVPLAQTLEDRLGDVARATGLLTVAPFLELVAEGGAGLPATIRRVDEEESAYWERVRQAIAEAPAQRRQLFDVIVVDEVQDLADDWIRLLERLLADDGRLLLLGDETQRTLRDGAFTPPTFDDGYARCQLQLNLRNTKGIAQMLSAVFARRAGRPRPGALMTLAIEHRLAGDRNEAADAVRDLLTDLGADGVPSEQIAVLTTSASSRDHLHASLELRRWDTPGRGVLCETVHRVKGLEFDTVVLVVDGGAPLEGLEHLLLIGVSRAVSRLAVVGDATITAFLRLEDPV